MKKMKSIKSKIDVNYYIQFCVHDGKCKSNWKDYVWPDTQNNRTMYFDDLEEAEDYAGELRKIYAVVRVCKTTFQVIEQWGLTPEEQREKENKE